jgi:hypothetical protein
MGPYGFSLALGATGLVVMAFLGFSHHGSAQAGHHVGPGGHGSAGHGHGLPTHAGGHHAGHQVGHPAGHAHGDGGGLARLTSLLSPRVLFSFLVGAGATGLLAGPLLFEPITMLAAVTGGYVFERFIVGPIWRFFFRFESRPAATLESMVLEEARAVTDFDARGQGLIQLELDGQVLQLLGTLRAEDRGGGSRIRRGDLLRIEEVDPARNQCIVSFAGRGPSGESS